MGFDDEELGRNRPEEPLREASSAVEFKVDFEKRFYRYLGISIMQFVTKTRGEVQEGSEKDAVEQLLGPEAVEDFRRALLHRDSDVKLTALNAFLDFVKEKNNRRICDMLVKSGVVESLGETINSLDAPLVCTSLSLLDELVSSKGFAASNRASPVVGSILRTVNLFAELTEDGVVVQQGLEMVSKIIMTLVQDGIDLQDFCNLDQLINVSQAVLKFSKGHLAILRSVTQIVYTVLLSSADALLQDGERGKEFSFRHLVAEVLNLLCRATHENPHIDIDTSICEVGAVCMSLFLRAVANQKDELEPLHALVRTAMTRIVIPHVKEWVACMEPDSIGSTLTLIKGIMSLYQYPDPAEKLKYSKWLLECDFLKILCTLEQFCGTWVQYTAVRSLMVEILVCLSFNELGGSPEDWKHTISQALKTLPVQGTLSRLEEYSFVDPISPTIIIYNYFILSASATPEMSLDLFQDICTYINIQKSPLSPPLFKAVWLCISVGYLLHGNDSYVAERANSTLMSLATSYELDAIYTHHVAILSWTFKSENTSKNFKAGVMGFWIRREDDSTVNELKSLLSECREAFIVYLELLATRCTTESAISRHLRILPDVLAVCDELYVKSVSYEAWALLPQVLLQACIRVETYGVIPLLVFCTELQPEPVDQDLVSRIACMVPGLVSQRDSQSPGTSSSDPAAKENPLKYVAVFKFMVVLLNSVQKNNESMILSPLLNNELFLTSLQYSLSLEHDELTVAVLELLSILLSFCKPSTICCKSVVLPGDRVTRLLYSRSGVVSATVKLLRCLLTADEVPFSSRVLVTIENPLQYLKVVYTRLHNIAFSGSDEVASWCWTCLHRLLRFSLDHPPLDRHLAALPYTHDLIRECAPGSLAWYAMMEFFNDWLSCQPPPGGDQSLGPVALDDTLLRIAQLQIAAEHQP